MSESAAELIWSLANPSLVLSMTLLSGVTLLWTRWRRLGRLALTAFTGGLLTVAAVGVEGRLTVALENRFPQPRPLPARVDGIIVLGGSIQLSISEARRMSILNHNGDRLVQFAALSRLYPEAQLVFTGAGASRDESEEWPWAERALRDLGADLSRVTVEGKSTSTYENAAFSRALIKPGPDEVWLLVTSAWHMPRAVGSFRAVGWNVVPYPVGYLSGGTVNGIQSPWRVFSSVSTLGVILREWASLVVYRYMKRTDALLPAP